MGSRMEVTNGVKMDIFVVKDCHLFVHKKMKSSYTDQAKFYDEDIHWNDSDELISFIWLTCE